MLDIASFGDAKVKTMPGVSNKPLLVYLLAAFLALTTPYVVEAQEKPAAGVADASLIKSVGTIKSVQPDSITVAAESGDEVTARLASSTKILRVPPGEKDLKNATVLQPQDLQPGDRVLVRGRASLDAHTIAALAVIVMKQADVNARRQHDREDWQKRGVDGIVTKTDASAGIITISAGAFSAKHDVAVRIKKDTILRRYAPDSIRFEDAKPATLDQIKDGDQLRARGTRSADSNELNAEEIVSGTFRNIAGTIAAIDAANNSATVQDRIAKGEVVIRIYSDSQIKKLPPEMAQRIAVRLKGAGVNGDHDASGAQNSGGQNERAQNASAQSPSSPGSETRRSQQQSGSRGPGGEQNGNGPPDFQRLLSRLPNARLADLGKGEVVMILSTTGVGNSGAVTAITVLAGVEPILTAAPSRAATSLLSAWSLSTSSGETEGAP